MHQNKGKSIADCLADRTDYAKNPDKTNDGELLSSYECDPRTVQGEFMLSKRQYDDITGRKQASNVIAYQIRQSFKPGEITPEPANKIGYELGMSFTKGNHAFIVATHIKVLDNGIIKQLKIQRPTYNKTPPLETMGGVFVCKVRHGLTIGQPRSPLDILSRG